MKERALLVGVESTNMTYDINYTLSELSNLAKSCEIEVIDSTFQRLDRINPKTYVGSGKVNEISLLCQTLNCDLVIFDDELTPSQIRNLEAKLQKKVIDRSYLILEIFEKRAKTTEAILEIKLAKLKYMLPRLIGLNASLSRQGGGSGATSSKGSGEKQIELDNNFTSNKTGFAFFHELFVKRHSKILTKAVKKQSVIILLIFAVLFIMIKVNPIIAERMNRITLVYLPYFVFIMYLINRSSSVTQAMFMNCDHSMLTYRIYRTPKVILGVFKERLKTLILINLLPAILIGVGLAMVLYLSGGTDNSMNYLIIIVSIIAMSIFFSVHYLVLYYLLQPYNASTEMKSSTYKVAQALTYLVVYWFIGVRIPTFYFGIAMIIFCVGYSLISLFIAYKYAPKTFKLRI